MQFDKIINKLWNTQGKVCKDNIITIGNCRISVLTPKLIRIEHSKTRTFVDDITQKVLFRGFESNPYKTNTKENHTIIETKSLTIDIDNTNTQNIVVTLNQFVKSDGTVSVYTYGQKLNTLKGTIRTLDNINGYYPLAEGLVSRDGIAIMDDSMSYIIDDEGCISEKQVTDDYQDVYIFGYGHDYRECIKDFFKLTGTSPVIPRYALGVWWSRYHKYTQKEYLDLMNDFRSHRIPLSVAVIDIDWHPTVIPKEIGTGWTGYTWNKEYFPDHVGFLKELHDRNLKVTLNVHPAEGVGKHEKQYKKIKEYLNQADDGKSVEFDLTDRKFTTAYFDLLHHPLEEEGVDFWWIDWQQGQSSKKNNLDPLWLLNHYHYLDINRKDSADCKALILSRYCNEGSHRYPVGFSGDSIISWQSLDFQPYFTVTATNVGYGWWSHDIGGHMMGDYDEELQIRWVQFGVFSPIMRLHSSASPFNHKEPWNYGIEADSIISRFLRLRKKLVPYLYTANCQYSQGDLPLLRPMYYEYPEQDSAYNVKNQYMFGSQLICAPITTPCISQLNKAKVNVWLPQGSYTDLFTGITYQSCTDGSMVSMYRGKESFPVLLAQGGIVITDGSDCTDNGTQIPDCLEIYTKGKADGNYDLIEDIEENRFITRFSISEIQSQSEKYSIHFSVKDSHANRQCILNLMDSDRYETVYLVTNDNIKKELKADYDCKMRKTTVYFTIEADKEITVVFENPTKIAMDYKVRSFDLLDKCSIGYNQKEEIYSIINQTEDKNLIDQRLKSLMISADFYNALKEVIFNN